MITKLRLLAGIIKHEQGLDLIEYALVAALVVFAAVAEGSMLHSAILLSP